MTFEAVTHLRAGTRETAAVWAAQIKRLVEHAAGLRTGDEGLAGRM